MQEPAFRFYHDQIPEDSWRDFYTQAEQAIRVYAPALIYPRVLSPEAKDYFRVLEYVYCDHPEFFYFNYYGCTYQITPNYVRINFNYSDSRAVMAQKVSTLNAAIDRVLAECFPKGIAAADELRREKKIFDWLTDNVVYDHHSMKTLSTQRDILGDAWTAYGALVLKNAVCEGIACAFKLLCDRAGLPSLVVCGDAGGRHAWNIVRVSGRFYQVDCTWALKHGIDLKVPYKRYQYLNLTDEIMGQDHTPEVKFLPRCRSLHHNPYKIKGLCCANLDDIHRIALERLQQNETRFAVLCVDFFPEPYALQALMQQLGNEARKQFTYYTDKNKCFIGFQV